ncbi:amino acid permease [soil metagenome]
MYGGRVTEPKRPLGTLSLLLLGINGIVGVGIFFTPSQLAAQAPGWSSLAVIAVTALALVPVALAVSILGSRFDEDGGPVLYARLAFGEAAGFVVGWLAYVAALFSMGTVMSGFMQAVLPPSLGPVIIRGAAIALLSILTIVASRGIKVSAGVWNTLTVLKLVPLIGLAVLATILAPKVTVLPTGATDWPRAMLKATFVFQGFEIVPVFAGQARSSRRAIPIAVLGSLGVATVLYLALQRGALSGVADLAHSGAPLVDMASAYGGSKLAAVVAIGTSVSALGIAFGMVATTPRFLSALAPKSAFGRNSGGGVPLLALWTTWVIVVVLICIGSVGELLLLSSLSVVMQYLLVAFALAKFGITRVRDLKPYHVLFAVPPAVASVILLRGADRREWLVAAACAAIGAIIYVGFARRASTPANTT